jgi:hypothetical protein
MKKILALCLAAIVATGVQAQLVPIQLLNPAGSASGQAIVSTGPSGAPAWATVTASGLTPIGANTVYGNFTGSSASPAANAVPSCNTANSALKYTTSTGLSCGTAFALTSGNLSQFASTTSAQLLGVLSDETGSGVAVFGTSPTIATPTISSPTISGTVAGAHSYSGALTFTSTIAPSQTAGIVGTTTNNSANAGSVGEYVSATLAQGSAVALTNGVNANVTSISLTAGDWDVNATACFAPAGTTQSTVWVGAISTVSATLPSAPNEGGTFIVPATSTGVSMCNTTGVRRISIASTTTVYLVVQASFTVSTNSAYGFIGARRAR